MGKLGIRMDSSSLGMVAIVVVDIVSAVVG